MAVVKTFRTALNGFNRQDVVKYIEYMNNRHNSQVQQLNNQLAAAQAKAQEDPGRIAQLEAALAAAEAEKQALTQRVEELEQEKEALTQQAAAQPQQSSEAAAALTTTHELEAYRRAERAERQANERARALCDKANAVLADVTLQTDNYAKVMDEACQDLMNALEAYKAAAAQNRPKLDEAARSLSAIRAVD